MKGVTAIHLVKRANPGKSSTTKRVISIDEGIWILSIHLHTSGLDCDCSSRHAGRGSYIMSMYVPPSQASCMLTVVCAMDSVIFAPYSSAQSRNAKRCVVHIYMYMHGS